MCLSLPFLVIFSCSPRSCDARLRYGRWKTIDSREIRIESVVEDEADTFLGTGSRSVIRGQTK